MAAQPDKIYQINDALAQYIVDYFNRPDIAGMINLVIQDFVQNKNVVVTNGHDDSIAWLPNLVVESNNQSDHRVATNMITQTHTFNILCQCQRTQNTPAEQYIRRFATTVQQLLYRIVSFKINCEGVDFPAWDIATDSSIQYGYRQARQVRVALITWNCKVDVPLHLLYYQMGAV